MTSGILVIIGNRLSAVWRQTIIRTKAYYLQIDPKEYINYKQNTEVS